MPFLVELSLPASALLWTTDVIIMGRGTCVGYTPVAQPQKIFPNTDNCMKVKTLSHKRTNTKCLCISKKIYILLL